MKVIDKLLPLWGKKGSYMCGYNVQSALNKGQNSQWSHSGKITGETVRRNLIPDT